MSFKVPETPECEKFVAVSEKSQAIGEFLDWLQHEKSIALGISIEVLLAEYFEIDLKKVEKERRHLLEHCRVQHGGTKELDNERFAETMKRRIGKK